MVRKRRTEASSEGGEGSVPREVGQASGSPGGGRGGSQRGGLQQGGGGGHQQGGRGYNTQSQQGGRGGGRGYGQPPQQQYQQQQQYGRGPQEYQGRGRGPPQIQSFPEPHQANSPTLSEVSPTKMPEHSGLVQQVEQLSLEQGAPSQAIQPLPSSSKAYKFPMRPGKGQSGKHCIVKDNPFFTELPDEDLQSLGDGLESWPGFYQSIRPTQMGSSLNIDMPSTAFIEALPVINFVCELLNRDISSWPLSDADLVKELVSHRLCPKMLSLSPQEEEMRLGAYSLSELEEALQGTLERELKATRMMIEDKDIQEWLGKAFKKHISEFGTSGFVDCFLHKSTKTSLFTDNFILKWISPARSHENKPVPKEIRSKKWIKEQKQGPVRAQDGHVICTLYAATDLISSLRLIEHRDTDFRVLSVKELCYFCGESERLTYTNRNIKHRCHSYSFSEVFAYIKAKGVVEELESETSFNCCDDPPVLDGREKYYIEDWIDMGHDLAKVYEQLKLGPVGASVLVFVLEYYATYRKTYKGPTSNSSRFLCGHAINIMSVWVDADGQPVFYCKSSHGTEAHDGGFLRVSGSVCLLGGNFLSGQEKGPELGLHNEDGHTLTYSRPLIGNFVVPVIKKKRGLAAPAVTKASKRLKKGKKKVESSDSSDSESEEEEKRKKTPAKAASSSDESSDDEPATKKAAAATNGSVAKKAKDNSSSEDDSSDEEVAATKKT